MKFYWIKTHWLVSKILSGFVWKMPRNEKKVYLTFDDGPTPEITQWTLEILKLYDAKATFFCIGENVRKFPDLFKKIQNEGHAIGNHTYNHLNGWKYKQEEYLLNVEKCQETLLEFSEKTAVQTPLFRPPYGKLTPKQYKALKQKGYKIIMWDILSADFDTTISPKKCAGNVLKNSSSGSIIIFHDSMKAAENLKYALPKTLRYLKENGYKMEALKFAPEQ